MGKRKLGALEKLEADLPALQNKIRRDPLSYQSDFQQQYQQYQSLYLLFLQNASTDDNSIISLREYIDFVAHCADCYLAYTSQFSDDLINLLSKHHASLEAELREKIVASLVLLRNKNVIDSVKLLNALFPILIATHSKSLRAFIFSKILQDIRSSNSKTTNHKLNRTFQNTLYNLVTSDPTSSSGLWAIKFTRELWKRQIWTDGKAVEIMKEAALTENPKVIVGGVKFFLGGDKEREEAEDESSESEIDLGALRHQLGINKKTKKRSKELKRAQESIKKKEKKKGKPHPLNFSALHLLNDPQGFAELLFSRHLQSSKSKLILEQKLLVLQLVTRLVGLHQLTLESLYSFFLKYLQPRQQSVTTFLACLAQASHAFVPPELLTPLVRKIANEFVSEASSSSVASAGLNSIREICVRQPLAMDETLLQDLVMYRKSKDKGVMMAAKGLLGLFRNVGAEMLHRRDRGKKAAISVQTGTQNTVRFGEGHVDDNIPGIELLEEYKEEQRQKELGLEKDEITSDAEQQLLEKEEAEGWNNWDVESDDDDASDGWINVSDDDQDINISDSDDDKDTPSKKKQKTTTTDTPPTASQTPNNPEEEAAAIPASTTTSVLEKPRPSLATTRILTPADLSKLRELQLNASITSSLHKPPPAKHADDPLTAAEIEGQSLAKMTKEEKIARARGDRGPDEKHVSTAQLRQEKKRAAGKSSTNKEKARQKNFFMTLGKARSKGRRSLTEVKRVLKGHTDRRKRGGKRGNIGM